MDNNYSNSFHLGLCMAGSISAGAYTAGVIDYLVEALENWQLAKNTDPSVLGHQVLIDLLCGSSGGGMTGAMTLFAMMDKMDHAFLQDDGNTYTKPKNNILWDCWVELTGTDVFKMLLSNDDINDHDVRSLLNSDFIDEVSQKLKDYINTLSKAGTQKPAFAGIAPEMFMTLFNVTGINYELHSKAATSSSSGTQFVSDHRDIAHFRWTTESYESDGRMPLHLSNLEHLDQVVDAAKATGAFPVGLRARLLRRKAKFIWDNPFFNREKQFGPTSLFLGKSVNGPDDFYTSINADGGTANNEPVELARDILLNMRYNKYKNIHPDKEPSEMGNMEKAAAKKKYLTNTSIILVDPFPSTNNNITEPGIQSNILLKYGPSLINAMNSQLIFDAKEALDAYKKENYGLHIISPSKAAVHASVAIACGSLGGFGGFLHREFRVHDFFLGRHNCQSFIRKYFVANLNEPDMDNRQCIQSILDAYLSNPKARERFAFKDEKGVQWVPIIPDVQLKKPIRIVVNEDNALEFAVENKLPLYNLSKLPADFLKVYEPAIGSRYKRIASNLIKTNRFISMAIKLATFFTGKKVYKKVEDIIVDDLKKRNLI